MVARTPAADVNGPTTRTRAQALRGGTSKPSRTPGSVDLLAAALAVAAAIVVGAQLWFRALQRVWPTDDPTLTGLQFGSFLVLLGGVTAALWGKDVGLRIGRTFSEWRLVLLWGAVLSIGTVLLVVLGGQNAYSESDVLFEIVLVPVGEELVFRGLLLGFLIDRLGRRVGVDRGNRLAVGYSAVAFGAAHASNVLFGVAASFVVVQVMAATLLGLVFGHVRVRTQSLLTPVLLHALVNAINLLD